MTESLEGAISGSFKFKPEIDELIDEFADYNVTILEPTKGWLYIPSGRLLEEGWRPLPIERGLDLKSVEDGFLAAVRGSDFLYVNNLFGYLGLSMAFEMGFANALRKPIFCREPFKPGNFEFELAPYEYWKHQAIVATPERAVSLIRFAKEAIATYGHGAELFQWAEQLHITAENLEQ